MEKYESIYNAWNSTYRPFFWDNSVWKTCESCLWYRFIYAISVIGYFGQIFTSETWKSLVAVDTDKKTNK